MDRTKAVKVLEILGKEFPDVRITLDFENAFQLLVATILAAQCTDERVNRVTQDLFKKYRVPGDFAAADLPAIEEAIRSTGFYHNKAKSLIACSRMLLERFNGRVPEKMEELTLLPGVGRKTANIILGNAYGRQAIAVDTHVKRVTHRLGWAQADDPDKIEFELMEVIPRERWTQACHLLIFHGRHACVAKKPLCPSCPVAKLCPQIGVLSEKS